MFISSHFNKWQEQVQVWEKTKSGKRILRTVDSPLDFYVPDAEGTFTAITGEKLKKVTFNSRQEFDDGCRTHRVKFESDLSPQEKVMMSYYKKDLPKLDVGFLDIEVDYDPKVGWPRPANPYAPINAITLYNTSVEAYFTLAVPPQGWTGELPADMQEDNYFLFKNERDMMNQFIELVDDCDILSGWNSEFFDMPYIGKRIELIFGDKALKRLAFEGGPHPRWGEKDRFKGSKEKEIVLDLQSRVHLDYMALFKKFTLGGRQSYSLAAISGEELNAPKMEYDGTLYELYRNDFVKFLRYNRHDVTCILDLDKKYKYIELANSMVHEATVNFSSIFGSVQLIDTAIINFSHDVRNQIVFDKTHKSKVPVEGAIVMNPMIGFHKKTGSVDINSLYPSTYRSLNLSPEKIVGQLAEYEEGWRAVYNANLNPDNKEYQDAVVTIIPEGANLLDEDGEELDCGLQITAGNMIRFLNDNKYALSGYGTILDQGNGEGLIPAVLSHWFKERKALQALKKKHANLAEKALKDANIWLQENPVTIEERLDYEHQSKKKLDICQMKLKLAPIYGEYLKNIELAEYYDMLQGVKKVLLNSSYGATLNEYCRFFDPRLGASTTGSGRQITTHMINTIAVNLIGDDAPKLVKTTKVVKGEIINEYTMDCPKDLGPIYSDTDSCYFDMQSICEDSIEDAIMCADSIAQVVNDSFPDFMRKAFFCQPGFDNLIAANREVVTTSGIFRAKKKYILLVADMEGKRLDQSDPKALKTQGSDIKISSTPETIREMLKNVTMKILTEQPIEDINNTIIDFRRNLNRNPDVRPLDYATITSVKNLDEYFAKWDAIERPGKGRVTLPANVRSSINHNLCVKMFDDQDTQAIISGSKIKMVWLKQNEHGFLSMAFSSDLEILPQWFDDNFEIDVKLTEQKLVDKKLENIFQPIGMQIPTEQTLIVNKLLSFD